MDDQGLMECVDDTGKIINEPFYLKRINETYSSEATCIIGLRGSKILTKNMACQLTSA